MMKTITLLKENIYKGNLLLINSDFAIQTSEESGLVPVDARFYDVRVKREVANILQYMFNKIDCLDEIVPVSGYRSASEQIQIYENSLKDCGENFTKKFVALPYHSEHQTGLAIDLALKKDVINFICPDFPYEGVCDDFRKAAPKYGFVERYKSDKETITGIAHEPWHFRYVGYPHSKIMSQNNFSLEEYIQFVKNYTYENAFFSLCKNEKIVEIFYVPMDEADSVTISLPKQALYQISGNNTDGFIVTLWRNCNE